MSKRDYTIIWFCNCQRFFKNFFNFFYFSTKMFKYNLIFSQKRQNINIFNRIRFNNSFFILRNFQKQKNKAKVNLPYLILKLFANLFLCCTDFDCFPRDVYQVSQKQFTHFLCPRRHCHGLIFIIVITIRCWNQTCSN